MASWNPLASLDDLAQGHFGDALLNAGTIGLYGTGKQLYEQGKDAVNGAYDKKAQGYEAVQAEIERLKGERMQQRNYAYNLADSKYEPTRKAIQALYGDPSGWSL